VNLDSQHLTALILLHGEPSGVNGTDTVMKKYDRISSFICILLASGICVESVRIDPGTLSNPGPGFLPLICGVVFGIFGCLVFIKTFLRSPVEETAVLWGPDTKVGEMALSIVSLIVYALLMEFIGFNLVTLVWMIFTCRWIGKLRWRTTILISVLTVVGNYILSYYLGIRFPLGSFWGFN
jgi:putative tricarboxylic transport membrane protein